MHIDSLLVDIGDFGWYQKLIAVCYLATKIPIAFSMMEMAFSGILPDFWCEGSAPSGNNTNSSLNICYENRTECVRIFDTSKRTIVNEWNLVCDKRWISFTITSLQMAGAVAGAVICSYSSDRFGRRKTIYIIQLLHVFFLVISACSPYWQLFAAMRFGIGFIGGATMVTCNLTAMEFVGKRWRACLCVWPVWSASIPFLPLVTWVFPNWRHFEIFIIIINIPVILGFYIVPESIRWLAVKGRIEEATKVAKKIARKNNKPLPNTDILDKIGDEERRHNAEYSSYTYLDLFRGKRLTLITLRIWYCWFTASVVYYGIYLGVQNMSGDFYLNFFLLSIVEIPSILVLLIVNRKTIGRRWSVAVSNSAVILGALGAIIATFTAPSTNKAYYVSICSSIATFAGASGWSCLSTLTAESYPTVIRNQGFGCASIMSRIGGIFASQLIYLYVKGGYLHYIIICVMMTGSICSVLTLPETCGQALEDTIFTPDTTQSYKSETSEMLQDATCNDALEDNMVTNEKDNSDNCEMLHQDTKDRRI